MKTFRHYAALTIRFFAWVLNLPSAFLYDLSNIIKNKEDDFSF